MCKIESFKYINSISSPTLWNRSVGELQPTGFSWKYDGKIFSRIQEKGVLCAVLSGCDNVIGVVENPYNGGFNAAYVLNGANQIIWDVSDLFIAAYGNNYYDSTALHFVDVRIEKGTLYFFINISNYDFRFSIDIKTGAIGRLIETR